MIPGIVSFPLFASTPGMTAEAVPESVSGVKTSYGGTPVTVSSGATTATVSGGTSPYTHSWALTGGDPSISATSPTSASTTFSATVAAGDTVSATFEDTIRDSNGIVATADCNVTLDHVDLR
jgi:acyl dehydratase